MTAPAPVEILGAVDPGARYLGLAIADLAITIDVDAKELDTPGARCGAVDAAVAVLVDYGCTRLLVELGPLHHPRQWPSETVEAYKGRCLAISSNHRRMSILIALLGAACKPLGITVEKPVPVNTWRRWLGCEPWYTDDGKLRGLNDRSVSRALAQHLTPEDLAALTTTHQRDAVGLLLGWQLRGRAERAEIDARRLVPGGPPVRRRRGKGRRSPLTPEQRERVALRLRANARRKSESRPRREGETRGRKRLPDGAPVQRYDRAPMIERLRAAWPPGRVEVPLAELAAAVGVSRGQLCIWLGKAKAKGLVRQAVERGPYALAPICDTVSAEDT